MAVERRPGEPDLVINLSPAMARLGQDEGLLRELATFYIEDVPPLMQNLEEGIQARDFELITRSAHSLKGLSANFEALSTVAAAQAMESHGRHQNLESAKELLPTLRDHVQRVFAALQSDVLKNGA
ncbi:Hpt domain-containing protein [Planctomicrobium sp. SH661]|uniref:Hpt domain-containing protein n=1 Tax=Planctomicrobium sp. SH661 TaxID=3448124 RepID=UPI003F5C1D5F